MDRKEWLKERHKGLGGSDSPVVLGVNPWKKPVDLWAEKRGLIEDDQEPSPAMRRGTALEPIVADMYTQAAGVTTAVEPEILVHPEHPWMLAKRSSAEDCLTITRSSFSIILPSRAENGAHSPCLTPNDGRWSSLMWTGTRRSSTLSSPRTPSSGRWCRQEKNRLQPKSLRS
ncbi:MAG: YqaJ viral recombinase family protein [Deltaproteobacteria bacterium]|nr:YqaJ viral recombinase family protein [Deltaproteobacteria bacterium]